MLRLLEIGPYFSRAPGTAAWCRGTGIWGGTGAMESQPCPAAREEFGDAVSREASCVAAGQGHSSSARLVPGVPRARHGAGLWEENRSWGT